MILRPEPVGGRPRRAAPPGLDRRSCSTRSARSSARRVPPTSPTRSHLVFVCPRYEGVDERIRSLVDLELSIGDYVLTGGELPALVVIDAVIRLLPGRHRGRLDRRGIVRRPACSSTRSTRGRPVFRGDGRAGDPDLGRPRRRRPLAARAGDRADPSRAGPDLTRRRLTPGEAVLYSAADARPRPFRTPNRSHGCPDESGTAP